MQHNKLTWDDFTHIDFSYFRSFSEKERSVWFRENCRRARAAVFDQMVNDVIARGIPFDCGTKKPLLPSFYLFLTLCGREIPEITFHERFFGTKHGVELAQRERAFLSAMEAASQEKREDALDLLKGRKGSDSILYTFKRRLGDLTHIRKAHILDLYDRRIRPGESAGLLVVFTTTHISPDDTVNEKLFDLPETVLTVICQIYPLCINFDLSADYFLRRDYSQLALLDGAPISEEKTKWLSEYLKADSLSQARAFCMAAYAPGEKKQSVDTDAFRWYD